MTLDLTLNRCIPKLQGRAPRALTSTHSDLTLQPFKRLLGCALALVLSLGSLPASAAPEEAPASSSNPVLRLLQSSGLAGSVESAASSSQNLFNQVQEQASSLVLTAMDFIGVRYRWGGTTVENGFDCSGFTRHIFENSIGLILPRRAAEQANLPGLLRIQENDLKPGDLVFFNTLRQTFSHVGIYLGDGKFVHAPRTGLAVKVEDMRDAYWSSRFNGARRVPTPDTAVRSGTQVQAQ